MALGRRLCALVVALALGVSAPLSAPRSCPSCPRDCPMHAQGKDGHTPRGKHLGCHRGAATTPEDGVCLRSSCGGAVALEAFTLVGTVARREHDLGPTLTAARLPAGPRRAPVAPVLEPPTEPPRSVLV